MESSLYRQQLPAPQAPAPGAPDPKSAWRRAWGAIAAAGLVLLKLGAKAKGLLLILPKLKILTTSGTMLVSIGAYALIWGWRFAVGFVLLLLVHEMGHVIQLRREGIDAGAPMFIPFLGALVAMKEMPKDAAAEARVGLAGPVLGSLASLVPLGIYAARRERPLPGARLRGLPPEPVQPASGAAARRRPGHGRPLPLDVVRGLRPAGRPPPSPSPTR